MSSIFWLLDVDCCFKLLTTATSLVSITLVTGTTVTSEEDEDWMIGDLEVWRLGV